MWRLPSKDELNLMYTNLHKAGKGNFVEVNYWSSTESDHKDEMAIAQYFGTGYVGDHGEGNAYYIRTITDFQSDKDYAIGELLEFGMIFWKDGKNYKSCRMTNEGRLYNWKDAIKHFT